MHSSSGETPDKKRGFSIEIAARAVKNPKITVMVGVMLTLWGILATVTIPKESAPYIAYGIVNISTVYVGTSAIDMDTLITQKIEDKIKGINGINKYTSVSQNSLSNITLEFEPGQDMTQAMGDVRSKVDEAGAALPADAEEPFINQIDSSIEPFLSIVLSGPYTQTQLTDFAEQLKTEVENIPEVANVTYSGSKEREIAVRVDQNKLESLGLSLNDITNVIRTSNRDTPIGDFEIDQLNYAIRFAGKYETAEDIRNIIVKNLRDSGFPSLVTIGDIADVEEREDENNQNISRFIHVREKETAPCTDTTCAKSTLFAKDVIAGLTSDFSWVTLTLVLILTFFVIGIFVPILRVHGVALPRYASFVIAFLLGFGWYLNYHPPPVFITRDVQTNPSMELTLAKKSATDILKADTVVKAVAKEFAQNNFPRNVSVDFRNEAAVEMRRSYAEVIRSGVEAFLIVSAFIFLFVGVMEGLLASIVIPTTFLVTIGILNLLDKTLNFMTNFSMILSLGILVDTAIVVVVGTNDFIKQGVAPNKAAVLAVQEYFAPLLTGTLTTVAVFIPLLAMPGILGQYLSFIPITVIITLIVSLAISMFLLPTYASLAIADPNKPRVQPKQQMPADLRQPPIMIANIKLFLLSLIIKLFLDPKFKAFAKAFRKTLDAGISGVITGYSVILRQLLRTRHRRLMAFGTVILLFFTSFTIPIPFVLFPSGDAPFLTISIDMPEGTVSQRTLEPAILAEKIAIKHPEVRLVSTSINDKSANIYVELLPINDRERKKLRTSTELTNELVLETDKLAAQFGASIRVQSAANGPPSDTPVAIRVIARNKDLINTAEGVTRQLTDIMKTIPHTVGVKNNIEQIPGEFQFRVDRQKAAALGIDPDMIAGLVRTALYGSTATTITRDNRDIDVIVEFDQQDIASLEDLNAIKVFLPSGSAINLGQVILLDREDALASIRRQDGNIAFTVSSLLGPQGNSAEITSEFLKKVAAQVNIPEGIEVSSAGENQENAALIQSLIQGLVIAILLIFLILVVEFNAYWQPVIILFTILFAQIGVAVGLYATGTPRSLAYILGAITLVGIVVNHSIIMVDQMNKNRDKLKDQGETDEHAFVQSAITAGVSRFVPVTLTTVTSGVGIIPLIFQDQFWAGLSYTVIFGLITGGILTLFITPSVYVQYEREKLISFVFFLFAILFSVGITLLIERNGMGFALIGGSLVFYILYYWLARRQDKKAREGNPFLPGLS